MTAVQLNLDTEGFNYRKWGAEQWCKRGDWIVNDQDDAYTVDGGSFDKTYRMLSPGVYQKQGVVWAEQAACGGGIETKEGSTAYVAGDWLVYNDAARKDGYAVKAEKFAELYEEAEG